MSTHEVRVVRIDELLPHPNAERLELVKVFGAYTCAVAKGAWQVGDLAAFIEPDYIVPETADFAFLGKSRRIGAKRLRGVWSEGLLVKAPEGAALGDNVMERMGIERHVPRIKVWGGATGGAPIGLADGVPEELMRLHKYDLENVKKFIDVFEPREPVYVTEKIHGANARFVFRDGQMWAGGRTQWRKPEPVNVYWEALRQNPWIEEWCRQFEGDVLYGEVFGQVQDLTYGAKQGQIFFRAFDVLSENTFLDPATFCAILTVDQRVPRHPLLPFDLELLCELAEQPSLLGGGICEGLVIKPLHERISYVGRVALKLVSRQYLARGGK